MINTLSTSQSGPSLCCVSASNTSESPAQISGVMPHTINSQLKVKNTFRLGLDRAQTRPLAGRTALLQSDMHQQRSFHPFSIEGILSDHRRTQHEANDKSYNRYSHQEEKTDRDDPLIYQNKSQTGISDEETNHTTTEAKSKSCSSEMSVRLFYLSACRGFTEWRQFFFSFCIIMTFSCH